MRFCKKLFTFIAILFVYIPQFCLAEEKSDKKFNLGQVVVTATKTERILADVPIETTLITKEEIEQSNAQTVSDLLKYTPGIGIGMNNDADQAGNLNWRATFRGLRLNEGYGLVLIDGQRVKGGGMGEYGYGINQIPPEMIERIEVVKGPGSVLYGSDAMAGVVNIITKPTPEKRFFSCYGGYGTHDASNAGCSLGDKIANFVCLLNYSGEKSDAGKYGGEDEYEANFVNSKLGYEFKEGKRLNLGIDWNKKSWIYCDWDSIKISPAWEAKFDDGSRFVLKGYWYDWDFHHFSPGYAELKGDMGYRQVESQYSRFLFDKHMATGGFEFLEEEIDYTLANKTVDTYSVFLQDEWAALDNLNLTLGVRFDSHSQFDEEVSPRISGLLEITDKSRVRGSVGRSFKSPTIRQLYYNAPFRHGSYYIQSNSDLSPEYGIGYSLGLEQEFSDRFLLNLGVFRNDIDDMVVSYDTGQTYLGRTLKSYKNIAEAYTQGIELELKANIFEELTGFLSYAFLDTEDKETENELTYRSKHTAGWRLNYNNKKYEFGANFGLRYVGSMFKDTANTQETDSYFVAEIKFIKEITEYAKVSFEIDNLFGTDYGDTSVDREGRTFMGKVHVKF
ncbi:TonB-dependent receptor [Patescibacteria group bacterium]|nr:TonB-dependent receptor [Patescibacteria group bacterium]